MMFIITRASICIFATWCLADLQCFCTALFYWLVGCFRP